MKVLLTKSLHQSHLAKESESRARPSLHLSTQAICAQPATMWCCGCVCMALADCSTKLWHPQTKDTDVRLKYCKGPLYASSVRIETQALVPLIVQSTSPTEQADSQADRNLFHRTFWQQINSIATRIFIELVHLAFFIEMWGNKWGVDGENMNQRDSCGCKKEHQTISIKAINEPMKSKLEICGLSAHLWNQAA